MAAFKPKAAQPKAGLVCQGVAYERRPDGSIYWTHTPPTLEQVKNVAWRPIWCAGYDLDEKGEKHFHHLECIPCHCPPGPQVIAIQHEAHEVALCGGRGSAKSEATFGFLTRGNTKPPGVESTDVDATYLVCSDYRFLVLRKNAKDLENYFSRAVKFFAPFGGQPSESPTRKIKFPSGAFGIFDHLADADAYEKYQGQEFTRIVIEEANQIPSELLYMQVKMSCRTSHPKMKPQVMLTANPGGPGSRWFNARFVNIKNPITGKVHPIGATYNCPIVNDPRVGTRVLIFSTVDDNPYQLAKGYDKQLDSLKLTQPTLWKRWRLGDMNAVENAFFENFRATRVPDEPPEALHVIPPLKLDPYWPRAIGCDWGYSHPSAVYWGCWLPKRQLNVYREFLSQRMGTVELGAEIAKRSLPDLQKMPNPHLNLYLSHDAFARTNEGSTEAEQIALGIERILGKDAAFVLAPDEHESLWDDAPAWESVRKRQQERVRKTNITIINAGMKRRGNMNLLREYMRWAPIVADQLVWDEELARRILMAEGALAYSDYQRKCEARSHEVLPVLQISNECPRLIESIQGAMEKKNDTEQMEKQEGDDPVDGLAYLAGNFRFSEAEIPRHVALLAKLEKMKQDRPSISTHSLIMAARMEEAKNQDRGAYMLNRHILPRRAFIGRAS